MHILNLPSTCDDPLFDALSAAELLRYSRTCKEALATVTPYIRRAFRVERLLSTYFMPDEIISFRLLQYSTAALISGSTAVQFFDRDTYPDSDLDLYVEHRHCRAIAEWLLSIGYRFVPQPGLPNVRTLEEAFELNPPEMQNFHQPHTLHGIGGEDYTTSPFTFNFEKRRPRRKIQLLTSRTSPMRQILNFHSTCVLNVITHEKAYCFYPRATLEERSSLVFKPNEVNVYRVQALQKYTSRGWKIVKISDCSKKQLYSSFSLEKRFGMRYVGDRSCWTLPLSPIPSLDKPPSKIEINSWGTTIINGRFKLSCTTLSERTLEFNYVVCLPYLHPDIKKYITECIQRPSEDEATTIGYLDNEFLHVLKKLRGDFDE